MTTRLSSSVDERYDRIAALTGHEPRSSGEIADEILTRLENEKERKTLAAAAREERREAETLPDEAFAVAWHIGDLVKAAVEDEAHGEMINPNDLDAAFGGVMVARLTAIQDAWRAYREDGSVKLLAPWRDAYVEQGVNYREEASTDCGEDAEWSTALAEASEALVARIDVEAVPA
jgi:hypothetical protein